MSFRFSWQVCGMAITLMACCRISAQTPSPPNSPPVVAATPVQTVAATNTAGATRRDGLKYLEEELTKSLQFLSGKRSLDGVMAPPPFQAPPPQAVIAVRPDEDSDSSKGWGALDRKDPAKPEESLDLLKRRRKDRSDPKRDSLEELYRSLNQDRLSPNNPGKGVDSLRGRFTQENAKSLDSTEDADLPSSMREKERGLRKALGTERTDRIYNPGGAEGYLSELFETRDVSLSRQDIQAHQDYLERYRQVLAGSSSSASGLPSQLKTSPGTGTPVQPPAYGGLDTFAPMGRSTPAPPTESPGTVFNPTTLPDMNSKVVNHWNPLYEAPRIEPPKPARLQAPPFAEAPRRRF